MTGASADVLQCGLLCFFTGFFLGLLYAALQILRVILSLKKLGTAVLDMLLFCAAGVASYLVAFAMNRGQLRFFQLALEILGFLIFSWTLYPVLLYPVQKIQLVLTASLRRCAKRFRQFCGEQKQKRRVKSLRRHQKILAAQSAKAIQQKEIAAAKAQVRADQELEKQAAHRLAVQNQRAQERRKKLEHIAKKKAKQQKHPSNVKKVT